MAGRRHDERPDHLHGRDRQRGDRADRVHRVHPRPRVGRVQPHLAATRGVVPDALRARRLRHRWRGGRRGDRLLLGSHRHLTSGRAAGGGSSGGAYNPAPMSIPAQRAADGLDLSALDAITDAVESGAGLPEVIRAAARALDASLVLVDRGGTVLAAATRSPADERSLLAGGAGIDTLDLRVADEPVGLLRMRARSEPGTALLRLVTTLVASEVERVRAPERASEEALAGFLRALVARELNDRDDILARAGELGIELGDGASVVVARAHSHVPTEDGWRQRVLAVADRGARAVATRAVAALAERDDRPGAEVVVLLPGADDALAARTAEALARELQSALSGHTFAIGRSRVASDPNDLHRAASEALLAANVAEGDGERPVLAFEETGAYRLLLSAMSEDPGELQRFYAETV